MIAAPQSARGRITSLYPVSIAPMMEKTDRHYRYLARQLTACALLYTEMITTGAIVHGDRDHLLAFDPCEHPLALQLGGDDPEQLRRAIEIAEGYGYDEYNLNVGCPSDRVQNANFGACLMARPAHVRDLIAAMRSATPKPVTVKHRIGIDGRESYDELVDFVRTVAEAGPTRFTVHARIAILAGLSPKENRSVPPLRYDDVYRLKEAMPGLQIEINGHVMNPHEIAGHLTRVDAVMVGRAAYDDPWILSSVDHRFFGEPYRSVTRRVVIDAMVDYVDRWCMAGWSARSVVRHMLGLFHGRPGARRFKQLLSGRFDEGSGAAVLRDAVANVPDRVLDEPAPCA